MQAHAHERGAARAAPLDDHPAQHKTSDHANRERGEDEGSA
jgi:hypothetical protein